MNTKGGKRQRGGDGGVMNWEIGIDMYTLMCTKLMTNKNLLYKKKLKKIKKFKKKKEKEQQDPAPQETDILSGRADQEQVA